jgi:hypothetical protein
VSTRLILADAETAQDVLTFAARAERIGADGVRIKADAGILLLSAAALTPQSLMDQTPTVLALRVLRADPELQCDLVVKELSATDDPVALELPETAIAPAWAAISPPRAGWVGAGELSSTKVAERARWGISAVAHAIAPGTGEAAVTSLRAEIWGAPDADLNDLPRGIAFAAESFGYLGSEEQAKVSTNARWTRITFRRGHILCRTTTMVGLTPVRTTGTAR